jgi:hypothetical protein
MGQVYADERVTVAWHLVELAPGHGAPAARSVFHHEVLTRKFLEDGLL